MLGRAAKLLEQWNFKRQSQSATSEAAPQQLDSFADRIRVINSDPYLCIADEELKLISVFDDLKYDRADLDIVSDPMRLRALQKLKPLGFDQVTGSIFENKSEDIRCILPKFKALGASPFDATRDTDRRRQDYFILTPTQAACQIINSHPLANAVSLLEALVIKHPVNLLRVFDYLEANPVHQSFREAIGHLTRIQREAVSKEPLKTRRALR
ncbi:MAG: hypothetical protein AAGD43_09140 [Pseudomonadota bacterium]